MSEPTDDQINEAIKNYMGENHTENGKIVSDRVEKKDYGAVTELRYQIISYTESLDALVPVIRKYCEEKPKKFIHFVWNKEWFESNKDPARALATTIYHVLLEEVKK